jgi:MOSC domain
MHVVSVNVGLPRTVPWKGREVTTGIFKAPVEGRVALRRLNLDGDRQADLAVHGGPAKAVYAYPLEHCAFWREALGEELSFGAFGENLTVDGLPPETGMAVGDRIRVAQPSWSSRSHGCPATSSGFASAVRTWSSGCSPAGGLATTSPSRPSGTSVRATPSRWWPAIQPGSRCRRSPESSPAIGGDLASVEQLVALDALPDDWRRYFEDVLAHARA